MDIAHHIKNISINSSKIDSEVCESLHSIMFKFPNPSKEITAPKFQKHPTDFIKLIFNNDQ